MTPNDELPATNSVPEGRSSWKKLRHRGEAFFCRIGFWIFPRFPRSAIVGLSRIAGWIAFHVASKEREIALANLELALGTTHTPDQRRQIALKSFQSFARTAMETLSGGRLAGNMDQHFEFAPGSLELLTELVGRKKGLIALTFHYGNWEWLSLSWGMAGFPSTVVSQPIKNPEVEKLFRESREQAGHNIIHRQNAARHLYKAVKRGGTIGLLVDLNSSRAEGGDFFDFFGVPAMTTRIAGLLSLRTGAPIVCSVSYPQADGRYRVEVGPEIPCELPPDCDPALEKSEIDAVTQRWLAHCEKVIRTHPEHWMWMYKRWKARPTSEMGKFPFYSFYDPKVVRSE